jgi:hypothetical protein
MAAIIQRRVGRGSENLHLENGDCVHAVSINRAVRCRNLRQRCSASIRWFRITADRHNGVLAIVNAVHARPSRSRPMMTNPACCW